MGIVEELARKQQYKKHAEESQDTPTAFLRNVQTGIITPVYNPIHIETSKGTEFATQEEYEKQEEADLLALEQSKITDTKEKQRMKDVNTETNAVLPSRQPDLHR